MKEMHFKGGISALLLIAETLNLFTRSGAPFLGLLRLQTQKTLTGGQLNLYVVCMYQLFEEKKKRKKNVAVAEPSVTFDVIEICLPFCHFCHSQPMYAVIFLTESAS